MSLFLPDRLTVRCGADGLTFLQRSGRAETLWTKRLPDQDDGTSDAPWQVHLATLAEELNSASVRRRTRLEVELPSALIRYRIIPWRDDCVSPALRSAHVALCFADAFGEAARRWTCVASLPAFGSATLGAAVDTALVERLGEIAAASGCRLMSVRPALMAAFNQARRAFQEDTYWFVFAEPDRYVLILVLENTPVRIRSARRGEAELDVLLDREWNVAALDRQPCPVYYADAGRAIARDRTLGQWRVRPAATEPAAAARLVMPRVMPRRAS